MLAGRGTGEGVKEAKEVSGRCQALACATERLVLFPEAEGNPPEQVDRSGICVGMWRAGGGNRQREQLEQAQRGEGQREPACGIFQKEGRILVMLGEAVRTRPAVNAERQTCGSRGPLSSSGHSEEAPQMGGWSQVGLSLSRQCLHPKASACTPKLERGCVCGVSVSS